MSATWLVYWRLVSARVRGDWQYRTSFLLFFLGQLLVAGIELATIGVLFTNVDELAGWTAPEVVLLFGLSGLAFGIGDLFISQVEQASVHIKAGTFDQFLIRPMSPLLQLTAGEFAARRIARPIQPAVALVVALFVLDVEWTPAKIVLVPVALVAGVCIFGALWVLTSSVAFWMVETQEMSNAFTYGGNTLTAYPVDVLGVWLRRVVVYVIPLAFVANVPAAAILDKPMPAGLPSWAAWLTIPIAVAMVVLASAVWRTAIRHYRSTGS